MMKQSITDRGFMDLSRFRIRNLKSVILAMPVFSGKKISVESADVVHKMMLKFDHVFLFALAGEKFIPGLEQIFHRNDILKGMSQILPVIEHMLSVYKMWYGYRDGIPKKSRYTLGDKIDSYFVSVLELLHIASYQNPYEKLPTLERALSRLDTLKFLLRIAWELHVFDNKKYEELSKKLDEVGKELGGWRNGVKTKTSGQKPEEKR